MKVSTITERYLQQSAIIAGLKGRTLGFLLALPFIAVQLNAVTAHANIIYPIDTTITSADPTGNPAQSDTVQGNITTDGTIGVIGPGNIAGWNLNLIDQLNAANDFDLTPANSTLVEDTGSALSATATGLSFNFSGSGEFLIQANSPGAFSGFHYFCFSTGVFACAAGETISPNYIFVDGAIATGAAAPVGTQPLDQPPSSVPEPAALSLLGLGLAGVGLVRRREKN